MSKLPAFQFYPGDWWKDPGVKMLTLEERGFWFQCLLMMHESEQRGKLLLNGNPMPEDGIAMVMGLDNQKVNQILTKLLTFGVASRCETTGAIMSRRMVKDEILRQTRANCGKLGGNPVLLNQKVNHEDNQVVNHASKQNPTPSSSSSVSSSEVIPPLSPKGEKRERFVAPTISEATEYGKEIQLPSSEVQKFHDHFTANGWKVGGRSAMKCWKAALRKWKGNWKERTQPTASRAPMVTL